MLIKLKQVLTIAVPPQSPLADLRSPPCFPYEDNQSSSINNQCTCPLILMLILPKHIQLCNQTFAYQKEIHYLCNQIKYALFGLGCPRSEKGCHRQLFFITPLEILSCHTSCHPPDRYSFSKRRMPSSHHLDSTHDE